MGILFENYVKFLKPQIEEYNRKTTDKIDVKYLDKEHMGTVIKQITVLAAVLREYHSKELHEYLLGFISDYYNISRKAKLKPKELLNHINYLIWFEYQYQTLRDEDGLIEDIEYQVWDETNIDNNYSHCIYTIDSYVNLLLSKTIDYLPPLPENEFKKLDDILGVFTSLKERLTELAKESPYFVYVFTKNLQLVPFSLRYLNRFCNLGDKIDKWVTQDNPLVNYINDKGFDVFAGWGNFTVSNVGNSNNVPTESKETVKRRPSKLLVEKVYRYMESIVPMYLLNDEFNMNNVKHATAFYRSITIPLYALSSQGYEVNMVDIERYFTSCKNALKRSKPYTTRKDRNKWFNASYVPTVAKLIQQYDKEETTRIASETIMNVYDHIFIDKSDKSKVFSECMVRLHHILARNHNFIYHSENPLTDTDIGNLLNTYQNTLVPLYHDMVKPDQVWIFTAAIAFMLNIRDKEVVDAAYNALKEWFVLRHRTEDNLNFFELNYVDNLLMSYHNKRELLEKLEKEPIDIANYGNAIMYYDNIINLLKKDVDEPITEGRNTIRRVGSDGIGLTMIEVNTDEESKNPK